MHHDQCPPTFADSEGLRALLKRLRSAGRYAWRDDPEARDLMMFVATRYASLARKHHLDPEDAMAAAFDAMRRDTTRASRDPWAVVTTAVRTTLIAEERANALLTSTHRARRPQYADLRGVERFSDQEADISAFHPAFHVEDTYDATVPTEAITAEVRAAIQDTTGWLVRLGWPTDVARVGVDYVCSGLIDAGSPTRAYEVLRRDRVGRVRLDLSHRAWISFLRTVLGHPQSPNIHDRRGVLARLLIGDPVPESLTGHIQLPMTGT